MKKAPYHRRELDNISAYSHLDEGYKLHNQGLQLTGGLLSLRQWELNFGEISIRRQHITQGFTAESQFHPQYTQFLFSAKSSQQDWNFCGQAIESNCLLALPHGMHQFTSSAGFEDFEILIHKPYLAELQAKLHDSIDLVELEHLLCMPLLSEQASGFHQELMHLFVRYQALPPEQSIHSLRHCAFELVIRILRTCLNHKPKQIKLKSRYRLVRNALGFFDQHQGLEGRISSDDLVDGVYTSPRTLNRAFKEVFYQAPYQFFLITRLNAAHLALSQHPQMTVADIAFEYGFSSSSEFIQHYQKFYGVTPHQQRLNQTSK
ncbi:helix-turn-helix transcriptional regulator [Paraferrimonas sedimenticola]|uniref:HTH araC/xylS-type domain-containing protein n=1 Tax=Paraferrimonas sedimenticola TaxID=375674 RepID=A0AA37RWU0_9GAMM|nr:helix-turn-helix transcriptional regulator [Paraferrimonas sedimenticola]GLP96227.1 hypothetical protein GCM10007895_15330 [Paraferrimonas sedimenticola]